MLEKLIQGGMMMIPLMACSVLMLSVLIERGRAFYLNSRIDVRALRARILELLEEGRVEDAITLCGSTPGPTSAVLLVGLQTYKKALAVNASLEVQRALMVKAMEDCKVCYDMSVRNAAGSIIQFLYGDDGMDASKIESQKVPYIEKQPGEIVEEYVFGDNFEELEGIMTEDAWASLNAPAALKKCRLAMADHFKNILADRDFIITQMFDYKVESTVMYPVSIMRTITIAKGL